MSEGLTKKIIVTGGNKGIGKALCQKLLKDYSDVYVLLGSRDESRGKEAVASIVENVGGNATSRIEFLHLDVADEASIMAAAESVAARFGLSSLYAIVNNAGADLDLEATLATNVYGPHHVVGHFLPLLTRSADPTATGRIVNISSGYAPIYVSKLDEAGISSTMFTDPSTPWGELVARLDDIVAEEKENPGTERDVYGLSKACLNAITLQTAALHSDLLVNSCTPGFIDTDLTKGYGATLTPEQGTVSALHCLFSPDVGTGRYYGSDGVRCPFNKYRSTTDPLYEP